ncbi:MAG TPA: sensor histidine kinase [Sphingomicrobium sp.]|jgi:two-component sensor histidine kinase|nr:sensor histidine kinase [Sphingomicrobium sp.]
MTTAAESFGKLSTPAKLLLILTALLLPIGFGLVWVAYDGIREANEALKTQSDEQARAAARSIESLIARNALALRIAANGRLDLPDPCRRIQRSLTIAPAVAQRFRLDSDEGENICGVGDLGETGELPLVAPGDIQLRIAPDEDSLVIRVGVVGGIATTVLSSQEIRAAAIMTGRAINGLAIHDANREIDIIGFENVASGEHASLTRWAIGNARLTVDIEGRVPAITTIDRFVILLPVVMWFIAALMTWVLVTRLLIQPLRRLQRAVSQYEPGDPALELPSKLGPATEIQGLRDAFARAVTRVQESEREMTAALEGQRRLVREVHHRVKNNLQVIASLLNIHRRTAQTPAASEAYGSIGRRVGALAIVHRNHYAEMEENRGISLRPLLSELAAELRAGVPDSARGLMIDLEVEPLHTTQDAAVSVAFLITEVVEFAMFRRPDEPVEITVSRSSDLTARLTLASPVLVPEGDSNKEKEQFERIISGLAKQLRSTLDRKLGRYSVDLPVFPAR